MLKASYAYIKSNHGAMIFIWGLISAIVVGQGITEGKWIYLGVIFLPALVYITMMKPFIIPFGMYALLIPFESILFFEDGGQVIAITKILGVITILALAFKGTYEGRLKAPNNVALWWSLYIIFAALSGIWAIKPELSIGRIPTAAGLLLLYLVCTAYRIQENEYETLKWFILIGGILASLFTIYSSLSTGFNYDEIGRTTIAFGERKALLNKFSFDLLFPLSICILMLIESTDKFRRTLLLIAFFAILFGIVLTGSRGGMVGAGVIFLVYLLSIKKKLAVAIMIVLVGLIIISVAPDYLAERVSGSIEDRGAGRLDIWIVGWKALWKYLIIGAGWDNFPVAYTEFAYYAPFFRGVGRAAHNIYLSTFVELGIIGFGLMITVMIKHYNVINALDRRNNNERYMLKSTFWALLIASFFLDTLWNKSFWLLWILIVMKSNIDRRHEPSGYRLH